MSTEDLLVEIERILPGGVGLAHADSKTIFVALAAPGDLVRIKIERQQGNLLYASITEIVRASSVRVEPPCPYFGRCGGCDFQQMTYEAQLAAKVEIIRDCLRRIARIERLPEVTIHASPNEWRYRGRATWQIEQENESIGYYERGSRRVCDVADCAVLTPELQKTLEQVRATPRAAFPPDLRHLEAVRGDNGISLAPEFAGFHTSELSLRVGNETYNYNAEAFFQINQELLSRFLTYALNVASGEKALDLYCGVGLFTLPLARHFHSVLGVESNSVAARLARRNVQQARLNNARIVTATVTDWLRANASGLETVDLVVLDPPRAGVESVVIKSILDIHPKRVTYVSCDPATLARDLKKLLAGGYNLDSIAAFDMFPQTHHVETVVHLIEEQGD